jgi:hypothetical protein
MIDAEDFQRLKVGRGPLVDFQIQEIWSGHCAKNLEPFFLGDVGLECHKN